MRKIVTGIIIASLVFFVFQYLEFKNEEKEQLIANTALIQKQIKNVGKLIVTEGNFSQVFTYKDSKKFYFDVFSSDKKAIVIVNAKVTVSYDLSKVKTEVIPETKEVIISKIPEPEININPNIEYYDMQQDYLNEFDASDFNKIKNRVNNSLKMEIDKSNLKKNAQNRLLSELQKIYVLTNSMGWTLTYNSEEIKSKEDISKVKTMLE